MYSEIRHRRDQRQREIQPKLTNNNLIQPRLINQRMTRNPEMIRQLQIPKLQKTSQLFRALRVTRPPLPPKLMPRLEIRHQHLRVKMPQRKMLTLLLSNLPPRVPLKPQLVLSMDWLQIYWLSLLLLLYSLSEVLACISVSHC